MGDFENSVAALEKEIESRNLKVTDIERVVAVKKLEICNREKRALMEKLEKKDIQLLELKDQLKTALKTLNENQAHLNKTISPLGLEKAVWCCDLQGNSNEGVIDSDYVRIRDRNKIPKNKVNAKDNALYELRSKLFQKEASSEKNNISQNTTFLESEIKRLELLLKEKDEQLSDQTEQTDKTVKTLRETEVESAGIITLLKSKNRLLEADVNRHNFEIKHLEELLQCKKTEIKDIDELLANALNKGDEQRHQLQQVLEENTHQEFESKQIISSLQMKIQALKNELIQAKDRNKCLTMAIKERDDQLRQNKDRLNDTLHQKEIEFDGVYRKHQRDIEDRNMRITDLKAKLDSDNSVTNERLKLLEKDLQKKEELLHKLRYHQQQELNKLHDKEELLERTSISLSTKIQQMQKEKKGYDLKVTCLQEMLHNANLMIRNTTEQSVHNLSEEEDGQLSNLTDQLQITLKQMHETETELDEVISSQKQRIQQLETEAELSIQTIANLNKSLCKYKATTIEMRAKNEHFENMVKEKDEQLRKQDAQLNGTLKRLRDTETKLSTLERKNQGLEADIEQRDLKVKDMDGKLASMRKEMFAGNELHVKQLEDSEKLLSEQKDQLQPVLTLSQEREIELKKQSRFLQEQVERCDSKVNHLEKMLSSKSAEIADLQESAKEKDNQISELMVQLQQTSKMLQCKDSETQENTSLTKKLKCLESEVEHHRRNKMHLDDMLKNTKLEMNQLRDRNELTENKMKEKENELREQCDQLNRRLKTLQEKVTELHGTIAISKKKNKDLEADIESRNTNVKELEEQLDSLKTEQMGGNEILVRELDEKDKLQQKMNRLCKKEAELNDIITSLKKQNQTKDAQLSELKVQRKQALNDMDEKEGEREERIISLKKKIKHLETEIGRREQNFKDLEEMLNKNEVLENRLKEKDNHIYRLKDTLIELQETETSLLATITSTETKIQSLGTDVEHRDLKIKDLEEMLDIMKAKISGGNKRLEKQLNEKDKQLSEQSIQLQKIQENETKLNDTIISCKIEKREKDDQISDLRDKLQQTVKKLDIKETEFKEIDTSQTKKLRQLESGVEHLEQNVKHLKEMLNNKKVEMKNMIEKNILLESMVKEKDNQLHEQREQLNRSSEALQEKETELGGTIKALKKKCHDLETDIECRDQQKHDLEKKLDKFKSDKSGTKELYEKEVRQISEHNYQLQQALNQLQKTEATLNEIITALKKQNQEKDNQIIEQRHQLKKALEQLGAKKNENEENDMLLKKKIKYLEAELERREQNLKTLEELLNRNELQEKKLKEKDEQNYQLKRTLKELQETESRLVATITATEKEKQGLQKDVDRRDLKIKDLEEMLESTKTEISGEYERLEKTVHEKDKQLSDNRNQLQQVQQKVSKMNELIILLKTQNEEKDNEISDVRDQLQHASKRLDNREGELKEIDDLQKNLRYLESELDQREQNVRHLKEMLNSKTVEMKQMIEKNILLESMLKGKDNQLHEQSDQLNRASEALQEKETDLGGIIKTLKKKCHDLETDIEHRDQQVHDLQKRENILKTDKSVRTEHHVKEMNQISEENYQLQQAVNQLQETEATLNEDIAALKKHNQKKDTRIFEQGLQLKKALEQLGAKKAETEETDMLLKKKIKYLEAELERREQNLKTQEEIINSTNTKMIELRYRNERLDKMMKKNEEALHVQTNQWQQEIQNLQREIEIRDRKVVNMEEILKNKNHENNGHEQNKDVREKNQKIAGLKDQLKSTLAKLRDTETELDETKTRLSKAMGDKLTDNNPNITDLSDRNRPTKLAERCAELYDNQWTDAFDILDKHFHTEENVIEALLLILQDSMGFCITKAHEQMEVLERELKFTDQDGSGDAPAGVRKLLKDCRKAVAHVAVGSLHKMYVSHLRRSTDKTLRTALEVSSYTTECLEICWFMVIQDPPVAFAPLLRKGSSFNTDLYKPYTSSGTHIDYVVWPALVLHEGGPILSKGVAQGYGKKSKKSTS